MILVDQWVTRAFEKVNVKKEERPEQIIKEEEKQRKEGLVENVGEFEDDIEGQNE